jgi:spermidine/putrescine transport system substrate-binding protein
MTHAREDAKVDQDNRPFELDPVLLRGLTQARVSRRGMLRGAGLAGLSAVLAACGVSGTKKATQGAASGFWDSQTKAGLLNFANWPLYMDVKKVGGKDTHPTLDQFTKQTGIKVNYKEVIDDNDSFLGKILPSLRAGQDTGWDLMVITNGEPLSKLTRPGYLIELDHSKLPNFAKYAGPRFKNPSYDPGNKFTLAWQAGLTGIAYNPKYTRRPITSFEDLFDPKFKGKVGMFGDSADLPNFAMAGLGIDPARSTEDDWKRAAAKLKEQRDKGLVRKYFGNSGEAQALSSGDVWLSMAYSGDVFQLNTEKGREELKFVVPKEGAMLWIDNMCIPAKAKHPLDAITYMDYVYRPDVAGALAEYINYVTPVPAAKQAIEADAAKATGEDKASLTDIARSQFVFPRPADLANTHTYRSLTVEEEKTWNRLFQPIFQS